MAENLDSDDLKSGRTKTVIKLIVFIIVLIIAAMSIKYIQQMTLKINPDITTCQGGLCRYACSESERIRVDVTCSDNSKVCCISKNSSISTECSGKAAGDICNRNMVCDSDLECVSLCVYCAKNPEDTQTCRIPSSQRGRHVDILDEKFKCTCTELDCVNNENSMLGTCIENMCANTKVCCDR